jgi:hypothetical protein
MKEKIDNIITEYVFYEVEAIIIFERILYFVDHI